MKLTSSKSPHFSSTMEGVVQAMPEATYRAEPALSTSDLKLMRCPAEFKANMDRRYAKRQTPAMSLGTMFHTYLLEPELFERTYLVMPDERSNMRLKVNKEWKAEQEEKGLKLIYEEDLTQLQRMLEAVKQEEAYKLLQDCETEVSVFSQDAWPIPSKCRVDAYHPETETVIDIKTTSPGSASFRGFKNKSREFQYDLQQWNYTHILATQGLRVRRWLWLVVETGGFYQAATYTYSKERMLKAGSTIHNYMQTLTHCLAEDYWPSWTTGGVVELDW